MSRVVVASLVVAALVRSSMSGKWAGSDRRARLPVNWPKLRAQVRKRARLSDPYADPGGRCEWMSPVTGRCSSTGTDCDHINRHGPDELHNLQWLCHRHHDQKTQKEALEARKAKVARGTRTPERHPGSIRRRTTP